MTRSAPFAHLPALDSDSGLCNAIIDTPRGSRNKYKYDETIGLFRLSKVLPLGSMFPFDFGFIPSTRGADGDAVDVLVLLEEPAFVGCLVSARLIGVLEAEQTEQGKTVRNDRLIAVLETPYNPPQVHALDELGKQRLDEIEHFFVSYNRMEGREFRPGGRRGPERAEQLLREGMRQFDRPRAGAS